MISARPLAPFADAAATAHVTSASCRFRPRRTGVRLRGTAGHSHYPELCRCRRTGEGTYRPSPAVRYISCERPVLPEADDRADQSGRSETRVKLGRSTLRRPKGGHLLRSRYVRLRTSRARGAVCESYQADGPSTPANAASPPMHSEAAVAAQRWDDRRCRTADRSTASPRRPAV